MMKICQLLTLLLAGRGVAATQDILDIAEDTDGFGTLVDALDASGLAFLFNQNYFCTNFGWFCRDYTVFAPTDDAFAALGEATLERLLDEDYAPHLRDILLYHAVSGEIFSEDITDGAEAETLNHEKFTASVGGGIQINDANVVRADVEASNGVVHVIDAVLLPSSTDDIATIATNNGSFTILLSLLERVGLVDFVRTTDKLTVFAPTDEAFDGVDADALTDEQVEDILKYHVVQGEVLTKLDLLRRRRGGITTVQGATIDVDLVGRYWWSWNKELKLNDDVGIVIPDVLASNGIVHAIDSVLIPPSDI